MAAVTDMQQPQACVEELELWIYGLGVVRGSRKVADGLAKVQVALGNIASKMEKVLYKKTVPEHTAHLQRLAQSHIQQQDQCVEITEESKALLEEINKVTMLLSKQFVQWDELLFQLESAKQVKPVEE